MQSELKPCPSCGALPCDWTDDPHKARDILIWTIARIREVAGVGVKPMLAELPDAIAAELARLRAENAMLREAVMANGPVIWRNAITNTASLIDRVRRSHVPKPRNKAYSAFDAALDDVIGKWVSFSRGVAPTTYAEAESEWKRFSATIAGGRDAG